MIDREVLLQEVITLGIFEVDEALRKLREHPELHTQDVVDLLLDVRQVLVIDGH